MYYTHQYTTRVTWKLDLLNIYTYDVNRKFVDKVGLFNRTIYLNKNIDCYKVDKKQARKISRALF